MADDAAGVPLGEYALLDVGRRRRTGVPEVVFGPGKTPEQIFALLGELRARDPEAPALATRCASAVLESAADQFPGEAVQVDRAGGRVAVGSVRAGGGGCRGPLPPCRGPGSAWPRWVCSGSTPTCWPMWAWPGWDGCWPGWR